VDAQDGRYLDKSMRALLCSAMLRGSLINMLYTSMIMIVYLTLSERYKMYLVRTPTEACQGFGTFGVKMASSTWTSSNKIWVELK